MNSECIHQTNKKSPITIMVNKLKDSSNLCNFCYKKLHKLEKFGVFKIISESKEEKN